MSDNKNTLVTTKSHAELQQEVSNCFDVLALNMRGIYADTGHEQADALACKYNTLAESMGSTNAPIDTVIIQAKEAVEQLQQLKSQLNTSQSG